MLAINISDFDSHKIGETEIIQRILGGEKQLYEILVRRYNQKLYRAIRGYLKDEPEIEDIMQNTYIKAFTKLYQFKQESSFGTWLIRIAINESLARIKERGKVFFLDDQSDNIKSDILERPDNKQLNPQTRMIRNESKQLLENAINQLDVKYRSVYILREVEEMSLKEIAEAMDLTVANVKVRLFRGKEMIKEKLFEISHYKNVFEFGFGRCDRITERVMKSI